MLAQNRHFYYKIIILNLKTHLPNALHKPWRSQNQQPSAKFIIFNTQSIVFDRNFLVLNTKFIIFSSHRARLHANHASPSTTSTYERGICVQILDPKSGVNCGFCYIYIYPGVDTNTSATAGGTVAIISTAKLKDGSSDLK